MKRFLEACLAAALLGFAAGVLASPTIELTDGSRIQGEIQGIENGVYTVLSPSLGTVQVEQSKIVRIVYGGSDSDPAGASGRSSANVETTRKVLQLQESLAQDPDTLAAIMSLQSDPQIQAILSDPAIARAIQDGDYASLIDNPKIQSLESNAKLQQLLEQHAH